VTTGRPAPPLRSLGRAALALAWLLSAAAYAEPPLDMPDGPGKAEVERACSQCHSLDSAVRVHRSRAQWEAKIDQMIARGAKVPDAEFDLIASYLAEHFGPGATELAVH